MNSLPKTVTRQRRGCDLNPGPSAPESSTLTTRLPSHPRSVAAANSNRSPRCRRISFIESRRRIVSLSDRGNWATCELNRREISHRCNQRRPTEPCCADTPDDNGPTIDTVIKFTHTSASLHPTSAISTQLSDANDEMICRPMNTSFPNNRTKACEKSQELSGCQSISTLKYIFLSRYSIIPYTTYMHLHAPVFAFMLLT